MILVIILPLQFSVLFQQSKITDFVHYPIFLTEPTWTRHIITTASKLVHTNLQAGLEDCTAGLYFGISLLPTHLIELVC